MDSNQTTLAYSNVLSILLTAIVSVVGTIYFLKPPSPSSTGVSIPSAGGLLKDTIAYIPHILLLFGVLADMFTYAGVYSIPSLVGLLSIPLNWVFKFFWTGIEDLIGRVVEVAAYRANPVLTSTPATVPQFGGGAVGDFFKDYDGCSVQGFSGLSSKYAPQTLVVTATVFSYYIFDLINNRGWVNATGSIVMFGVIYILQSVFIGSCSTDGTGDGPAMYLRAIAALSEGLLFGGSAYGVVQAYYPTKLPTAVLSPFPPKNKKDLKQGPDGKYYDGQGNPYIVLPNGLSIPDLSSQDAKTSFANTMGNTLGTGMPAIPASCNASS